MDVVLCEHGGKCSVSGQGNYGDEVKDVLSSFWNVGRWRMALLTSTTSGHAFRCVVLRDLFTLKLTGTVEV
jgi:hypothetical protein